MTVALLALLAFAPSARAQDPASDPAAEPAPEPVAAAPAADYKLNPAASTLYVVVLKDPSTFAAGQAHDHTIGATGWSGTVHWDPSNANACKINITVPISGLKVDPPGYRAKAGIDPEEVSDSDKATITGNFSGKNQLDAANYPNITFQSTGCIQQTGNKYTVTGTMGMHGKTRPTTVSMNITADGTNFKASGRFDANHTDWGITPFSAVFGAVKNLNKLTFVIDVSGTKG
jgi:polyisoprenoid-binding protein YceI